MNGVLNVYKEKGYTSHDVVAKLRGILKQKKIGHTGTLDPDAVGVLPVCLGKATKLCDMLTEKDKSYETVLLLGTVTDTQDTSGRILEESPVTVTEEEVRDCIRGFVGEQMQIPPMYSALKVNGKKLYELAREGIEVERRARKVSFYSIDVTELCLPRVSYMFQGNLHTDTLPRYRTEIRMRWLYGTADTHPCGTFPDTGKPNFGRDSAAEGKRHSGTGCSAYRGNVF